MPIREGARLYDESRISNVLNFSFLFFCSYILFFKIIGWEIATEVNEDGFFAFEW